MTLRPLSKILALSNLEVSVDSEGTNATVKIPGISNEDIDRSGNISVLRIQKLLSTARYCAYHASHPVSSATFLEYDKLLTDKYTFMASSNTRYSRDLYALPDKDITTKLDCELRLGYVGNSSLSVVARLQDAANGTELVFNRNQVVTVDKASRKPSCIPDWWKDKYTRHGSPKDRLIVPRIDVPNKTFTCSIQVRWSDTDRYKHTNYISYISFCLDAAMVAVVNGHFSKLKDDILNYHVEEMNILYRGESRAGDLLDVCTWENQEDPYLLHFDVKNKGQSIFQNSMKYYEPVTNGI